MKERLQRDGYKHTHCTTLNDKYTRDTQPSRTSPSPEIPGTTGKTINTQENIVYALYLLDFRKCTAYLYYNQNTNQRKLGLLGVNEIPCSFQIQ